MGEPPNDRVTMCQDGKFRWVYEMSLFRNPTILYTVVAVFLIVAAIMWLLMFFIGLGDGISEAAESATMIAGVCLVIMIPLCLIGYTVYALSMKGKYCVVFEMDEDGVLHAQQEQQAKKAGLLADIGVLAGILAGNPTLAGSSLLAKTNNSMYTEFSGVKLIKPARGRNTIYVDNNQVYVPDEDFDMVLDFIRARCPDARKL
jgi:hypothetical protein